ncbi:MAG: hypothetical protein JW943_10375 [Deltaproteobacteria bacterium]|nr:hypothetical protein [Deltaproteobacteria bacterium]
MIYINRDGQAPPPDWLKKAEAVKQKLENATTLEERLAMIKKHASLWGELKEWLLSLSHNKCWYTEARNDSSHYEVEHFRPKKWPDDSFEGYWWLAFEWQNYRICGNAPNRKKGAFFPLQPASRRASCLDRHFVDDELNTLLDPTDPADPLLLSFDESGVCKVDPHCAGWEKERATTSIDRYGLNSLPQLCEGRQKVWQECRAILDDLFELHNRNQQKPTASCKTSIKEKTKQLMAKVKKDQPFSAVARACIAVSGCPGAEKIASL